MLLALVVGVFWLFHQGRGLSFFGDDWEFIFSRQGFSPHTLLAPVNGALDLTEILIYKVLLGLFGISSYRPFQATLVGLHVICVTLLFFLARRRLGDA